MPLKAYLVEDPGGYRTPEIVFAETPGRAKARTEDLGGWLHFTEMSARRAPEYDQYVGKGGPTRQQLFEHHGWWYECNTCRKQTTSDEGHWVGDGVMCLTCSSGGKDG